MLTANLLAGNVLAGIAYDPTIRGILAVVVAIVVLCGSVYLLLATNTGNRLGFLLALTGLFGWMTIMGIIWWINGIGMTGAAPSWKVVEYNAGNPAAAVTEKVRDLDLSTLPQGPDGVDYEQINQLFDENPQGFKQLENQLEEDTGGWRLLPASDAARNEAEATVASALPNCDTCNFGIEEQTDYTVLGAFEVGGKKGLPEDPNRWDRIVTKAESIVTIKNPKHYAVVQVQKVVPQEAAPGEPPPTPKADVDQPIISVVLIRDIGDLRFPPAMVTLSSGLIFALLCWMLHQRERVLEENLAAAEAQTV